MLFPVLSFLQLQEQINTNGNLQHLFLIILLV